MDYKTQIIKGTEYVYEDIPYWDPQKKQGSHKRIYIGKKINGEFIPNKNYKLQQEIRLLRDSAHENRSFCGAIMYLNHISRKTGISDLLQTCFPNHYKQLLSIIFFLLIEHNSFTHFSKWSSTHFHPYQTDITVSELRNLLLMLTPDRQNQFQSKYFSLNRPESLLAAAVTFEQIGPDYSSGLQQELFIQWEKAFLPSQTLLLIFDSATYTPICFHPIAARPSGVDDYISGLSAAGISDISAVTLILPSSFWSINNINRLCQLPFSFIYETDHSINFVQERLSHIYGDFLSNSIYHPQADCYSQSHSLEWDYTEFRFNSGEYHRQIPIYTHYYYSLSLADYQKQCFRDFLCMLEKEITSDDCNIQHQNYYRDFFIKDNSNHTVTYTPRQDAIDSVMRNCGFHFYISDTISEPEIILKLSALYSTSERFFEDCINRLNVPWEKGKENQFSSGKCFLYYISLILLCAINKEISDNEKLREFTPFSLLDKLDCIQGQLCPDGSVIPDLHTNDHEELMRNLKINPSF